jgi:hypothetical protein
MAKQEGILPLNGTIDNLTFYKSKDGYIARKKGGITADRIANDPAFLRTRENGAEFGRANAAAKLLRTAFRALLLETSDSRMGQRLTRLMVKVIQADATNARGLRNVIDGEAELLKGFEFNETGKLGTTLYAPFTPSINRATGELKVDIPAFIPVNMIGAPAGATHYNLVAGGAAIDFTAGSYMVDTTESGISMIDANATTGTPLVTNVGAASVFPLFLVMGIQFFQEVNGQTYLLKNGSFNALSIVDVSGI